MVKFRKPPIGPSVVILWPTRKRSRRWRPKRWWWIFTRRKMMGTPGRRRRVLRSWRRGNARTFLLSLFRLMVVPGTCRTCLIMAKNLWVSILMEVSMMVRMIVVRMIVVVMMMMMTLRVTMMVMMMMVVGMRMFI